MDPVSVGASIGIYRFDAKDDADAAKIAESVRTALKGGAGDRLDEALQHATFVTTVEPYEENYAKLRQRLTARVRRAQMASANVVYPQQAPPADDTKRNSVCTLDLVRPAARIERNFTIAGQDNPAVSQAVFDRRGYGLEAKQQLYQRLLPDDSATWQSLQDKVPGGAPFALMLSSISENSSRPRLRSSLRDKICVMYADGTGFGELEKRFIAGNGQDQLSGALSRQREFDEFIRNWRRRLLGSLLDILLQEDGYGPPSDDERKWRDAMPARFRAAANVVRIETLLWGGDEQLFVLPARLGWRFAEAFTDHVKRHPLGEKRLDHGVGLIFCHNDAPIGRIRDLAGHLCDAAKSVTRDETMILPVVLESFDHIGGHPEAFFRDRTPRRMGVFTAVAAPFALNAAQLAALRKAAERIAEKDSDGDQSISRRQIRRLAYAMHTEHRPSEHDGTRVGDLLDQINAQARDCFVGEFDAHYLPFASHKAPAERFWMLIDAFWDYLVPEPAQPEAKQ
nr:hypothetical protein [uncultured Rhodopila sp.]